MGPYQLPIADVAVTAQAHQGSLTGLATSIGEQPLKGLLAPGAMARLALAEALTNLAFAPVTALPDVRASVNWMHAAKVRAFDLRPAPDLWCTVTRCGPLGSAVQGLHQAQGLACGFSSLQLQWGTCFPSLAGRQASATAMSAMEHPPLQKKRGILLMRTAGVCV